MGLLFAEWFVTALRSSDQGFIAGASAPLDPDDMFPVITLND